MASAWIRATPRGPSSCAPSSSRYCQPRPRRRRVMPGPAAVHSLQARHGPLRYPRSTARKRRPGCPVRPSGRARVITGDLRGARARAQHPAGAPRAGADRGNRHVGQRAALSLRQRARAGVPGASATRSSGARSRRSSRTPRRPSRIVREAVLDRGESVEVHDVPLAATGPNAWEGDRYYSFIASPVEGPDGCPAGMLNLGYETTAEVRARKLLERELATEQRIANQLQVSLMPDRLPGGARHGRGLGLSPCRRRPRDRRRLLRRVPRQRGLLDGRDRRCLRQGRRGRGHNSAGPLHAARSRHPRGRRIRARCSPSSTRRCCASARICGSCPRCARSWSR